MRVFMHTETRKGPLLLGKMKKHTNPAFVHAGLSGIPKAESFNKISGSLCVGMSPQAGACTPYARRWHR